LFSFCHKQLSALWGFQAAIRRFSPMQTLILLQIEPANKTANQKEIKLKPINPYINFNGKCREAMTFYQKCFGGHLELLEVKNSPVKESSAVEKDKIFHASLTINEIPIIMGSDMQEENVYAKGNNIALGVTCSSEEDIHNVFETLSLDGKVQKPLKEEFWGGIFGSLEDQFGIIWFLNFDKK
jgi:PhnB protein